MLDRNKLIALVRSKGPVLPVHITKELNTSPIFAGAILSELVDSKQLKLSAAKIGGSPVYYCEGQEGKLPGMLYNYLHEKEKKAYDLLKSRGILRDKEEEPVVRVALRAIKDFAIPFEVKKDEYVEIFWKYFLISDTDAEKLIREILASENPGLQEGKKNSHETENLDENSPVQQIEQEKNQQVKTESEKSQEAAQQVKTEQSHSNPHNPKAPHQETIKNFFQQKKQPTEEEKHKDHQNQTKDENKNSQAKEKFSQQKEEKINETEPVETKIEINEIDLEFSEKLQKYFKDNKIIVEDEKVVRKNSEYEFVLRIPSAVGNLAYFCKAKNKKKVSDGDLSSFFVQAQMKKMPGLFLTVGVLTKKAKDLLENEFRSIKVKNIEEK